MIKLKDFCLIWNNQTIWPYGQSVLERKAYHCHLVAGVYQNQILYKLYKFGDDPNLYICSNHVEILHIILEYLQCSLDIEVSSESFGGFKTNNQWNGILSLIEQKKIDFIPFTFSLITSREEILYRDFVLPQHGLLTILSYPKATVSKSVLKLFESFSLKIWLLISLSFIFVGIAVNVICCVKYHYNRYLWMGNLYQNVSNYFYLLAILLGQSDVQLQRMYQMVQLRTILRTVLRTPLIVWMLATFLFRQLYSSNITAVMLSRSSYIIDRFEQLDNGDITILVELNSITQKLFVQNFPWLQPNIVPITSKELASIETVARLMQSNTVLVHRFNRLEQIRNAYSTIKLHVSEEGFINIPTCYGIRKTLNGTYQRRLNKLFQWLYYTGIFDESRSDLVTKLSSLQQANPKLSLNQLLTIINKLAMEPNETTWYNRRELTIDDLENLESHIEFTNGQVDIGIVVRLYLLGILISVFCLFGEIVFILRLYLIKSLFCILKKLIKRIQLN